MSARTKPLFVAFLLFFPLIQVAQAENDHPLPSDFSGTAVLENFQGEPEGWVIGSRMQFRSGNEWEVRESAMFHGPDLGYAQTDYVYSTRENSFRYNYVNGVKSVGLTPEGEVDRLTLLSPMLWYELIESVGDKAQVESIDELQVYTFADPVVSDRRRRIGVDPSTNQVAWAETLNSDNVSLEEIKYAEWESLDDSYVPTYIEAWQLGSIQIRVRLTDLVSHGSDSTPPLVPDLGNQYTLHDYQTMETYDAHGNLLGAVQYQDHNPRGKSNLNLQAILVTAGVVMIIGSGIMVARRRLAS